LTTFSTATTGAFSRAVFSAGGFSAAGFSPADLSAEWADLLFGGAEAGISAVALGSGVFASAGFASDLSAGLLSPP
jgi:hypothetical protein